MKYEIPPLECELLGNQIVTPDNTKTELYQTIIVFSSILITT